MQPVNERIKQTCANFKVTPTKGIENRNLNCWMNSLLQVICGISIHQLFPKDCLQQDPILKRLHFIYDVLQSKSTEKGKPTLKLYEVKRLGVSC